MSKILGVDFGEKNIGLAESDEDQIIAKKLTLIKNKNFEEGFLNLVKFIKDRNYKIILIGNPLNEEGQETEMSKIIQQLEEYLSENLDKIKIIKINEYLSSNFVYNQTAENKFLRKNFDSEVARHLLQSYLDNKNETK